MLSFCRDTLWFMRRHLSIAVRAALITLFMLTWWVLLTSESSLAPFNYEMF